MRRKYNYFVDGVAMPRKDFLEELKRYSQIVKQVDVIAGWCGIDMECFDEERFKNNLKTINNGIRLICFRHNKGKEFYRKEVKV